LGDQTEKNEIGRTCGMYRGQEKCMQGQPEGKRPLERHKNRREDSIKTGLQEREWGSWTGLIWLRTETYAKVLSTQY